MSIEQRSSRHLDAKHTSYTASQPDPRRELALLRELVLDRSDENQRARALHAYLRAAQPDAARLASDILLDEKEDAELRASAAACLGRAGAIGEAPLLQLIERRASPIVMLKAAKALGRIGGAVAVEALQRLAATSEGDTRIQAAFALQLVAHRTGMRELTSAPCAAETLPPVDMRKIVVREAGADCTGAVIRALGPDCFGINLDPDRAFDIECAGAHQTLVFDREGNRPLELLESAVRRPRILGLLVGRARVNGNRFVSRVILAGPLTDDQFYLSVHRTDGRLVHSGSGVIIRGESAEFSLVSVRAVGNFALTVRGRVRDGVITWDLIESSGRVFDSLEPEPLVPRRTWDPQSPLTHATGIGDVMTAGLRARDSAD